MKLILWAMFILALLMNPIRADENDPENDQENEQREEEDKDKLSFIADGKETKDLPDSSQFTPNVMSHNDARDVLRKLVKEKETAFFIQFY